jgi:hypothetical protein
MRISNIAPMVVSGVQHLVERAYRESGDLQYLRELLINALEAGATRVEFGPEWQAVARDGVYRLMVADDGKGMSPEELLKFLNTFGGGGKPIGDAHENFGVGAKTSLLPWNHHGVIVMSWTDANPQGAMVWLMRDPASGEYGARKFETVDGTFEEVIIPPTEWSSVKPAWITSHGTVVVCMGNTGKEHTFLGKTGDGDIKGIGAYLNKRLWQVPGGVEIYVQELRSAKRVEWPRNIEEAAGPAGKPDRRWNRRQIRGAAHFAIDVEGEKGKLAAKGTEQLSDGTEIDWYLWEGERPAVHSYAHMNGYIAALYKNELYDTQQHASHFRSFGITQKAVRDNLTLIARPPMSNGKYGVYPDTARNALKVQGTKRAGEALPWADWAQEFAEKMPTAIREALAKAGPASSGTIRDSKWKERLIDRFSSRWKTLRYVVSPKGKEKIVPDESLATRAATHGPHEPGPSGPGVPGPGGPQHVAEPNAAKVTSAAGTALAASTTVRGGLPEWTWTTCADIDESGAYAVAWMKPNKDKPTGLVQLGRDFPVIVEVKKYWRLQYADHLGDEIDRIIEDVYGEVMVARLAHSEELATDPRWGRAKLELELRSPAPLTMALLGLLSEDHLISARMAGLGVRRKA